jgi:hypothetical protein
MFPISPKAPSLVTPMDLRYSAIFFIFAFLSSPVNVDAFTSEYDFDVLGDDEDDELEEDDDELEEEDFSTSPLLISSINLVIDSNILGYVSVSAITLDFALWLLFQ